MVSAAAPGRVPMLDCKCRPAFIQREWGAVENVHIGDAVVRRERSRAARIIVPDLSWARRRRRAGSGERRQSKRYRPGDN